MSAHWGIGEAEEGSSVSGLQASVIAKVSSPTLGAVTVTGPCLMERSVWKGCSGNRHTSVPAQSPGQHS